MTLSLTTYADQSQPFLIHHSSIRGRLVRLEASIDTILHQHDYPPVVSRLLAEMALLVTLLSGNLKGRGKLSLQLRGKGAISFIIVDITAEGALRGYAELNKASPLPTHESPTLSELLGEGYLAITLQKSDQPYQGIVALTGDTLSECLQHYFTNSEQSELFVKTAIHYDELTKRWSAGGLILQHVPVEGGVESLANEVRGDSLDEDDGENWRRNAVLAETTKAEELLDMHLSPQALLYRLYNEDGVWIYDAEAIRAECGCSREKMEGVLAQFPAEELADLRNETGQLEVNCQFCNKTHLFD